MSTLPSPDPDNVALSPPPLSQDHLSHPTVPFYVGATIESLHVESTDQRWKASPRPCSGPIVACTQGGVALRAGTRREKVEKRGGGVEKKEGDGDSGADSPDQATDDVAADEGGEREGSAAVADETGGKGDRLVKKVVRLNQFGVYWNPAEDGNPCSIHLSDIPVDQAEVVISRQGIYWCTLCKGGQ